MIIYHPLFDVYHGVFRILQILEAIPRNKIDFERLKIIDFYMLFPSLLKEVSFPMEIVNLKKKFKKFYNTYESIEDPYRLFIQLESFQNSSIGLLIALDFIKSDDFNNGIITRTLKQLPRPLTLEIQNANKENNDVVSFLTGPFVEIELYGDRGLKARTKLMEYKYDPK